ncbi:MAG: DNA polymerase/3'-5' exonuclease PolX [Planctomycetota bacterium]|nr:DNA polymerase/3'-5' exonuclease PolX [Planctomycetota bacterium]
MSLTNPQIAEHFQELADLLEFGGTNPFRIRAYRNSVRVIGDYPESLADLAKNESFDLTDIPGIGDAVAKKIKVLVDTGELPQLQELKAKIPESVLDLLRVPGMGPKKAAVLYKELDVQSLEDLAEACRNDKVKNLKGFGAKTQQAILDGIQIAAAANERIYWATADELVQRLRAHLKKCEAIQELEFAGSYRRGKETVGDLDVLVVSQAGPEVMDHFGEFTEIASVTVRGDTKMSVRTKKAFQIDLRVVPRESFGAALAYFTGSKEHNVALRSLAKQKQLRLNEWGVFDTSGEEEVYVSGQTETEVYETLGLSWIPPELRENRIEFSTNSAHTINRLIDTNDLRGDLHMHTTATDGKGTLEEMVEAARSRGLQYIAITDHSQRVSMARGLTPDRLLEQWDQIDDLNAKLDGSFRILKGIECDILEQGGMDLPDEVLAQADWVLGAIHYGQQQSLEQITERILEAIRHPEVDAIAHPTGRLLLKREPYAVDLRRVMTTCAEYGKALEINANPMRLDLNDIQLMHATELGIPIVINSDAHSTDGLDVLRYGILQARRGGLTPSRVLNTLPLEDFLKWRETRKSGTARGISTEEDA